MNETTSSVTSSEASSDVPSSTPTNSDSSLGSNTYNFDGLIIEVMKYPKPVKDADNKEENDSEEGDDASTVCLDETETAEDRLKALMTENINDFDKDTFVPEPVPTTSKADPKLEVIAEEIPANEDSEEHYEGAAGLWAQDYQFPCFKAPMNTHANRIFQPQIQRVELQTSASAFEGIPTPVLTDWFQKFTPPHVEPPKAASQCAKQSNGSMLDALSKLNDNSLNFTTDRADCGICQRPIEVGRGVVLKGCLHPFCRRCLTFSIENNDKAVMSCPFKLLHCEGEVRDDEIKALLTPEAYEEYEHKMLVKMGMIEMGELQYNHEFVETHKVFQCGICLKDIDVGDGIRIKECLDEYCKPCLTRYIQNLNEVEVPCPFRGEDGTKCIGKLVDSEIRSLVPMEFYRGLIMKSLSEAEAKNPNAYHCKTPDCIFWAEIDGDVEEFQCSTCQRVNCVKCKAVHEGTTCQDYQDIVHGPGRRARENEATENQVRGLIASKNAQPCPNCGIITQRIEGCRHMTCTKCKHEFQWVGN